MISTRFRCRHQECNFNQLLRHPKYYRSSNKTTKHANITQQIPSRIQPQIHKVAFGPGQQENRNAIVEYAKKLPPNTRDKLLRKIAKKNSYIKTLDDAFKQAIEINRETSFVEAASGRYNNQNSTKIETQINELDDSFQDCNINAMNTTSTNTSGDRSFNGFFR